MPRRTVDFSEVQDFALVDEGEYEAEITGCKYVEAQSEDKYDYINVETTVREEGEFENSKVWGIWSMSPKALWRMLAAWENLGLVTGKDEVEIDYDEDADNMVTTPELIGMPCRIVVKHENYEGTTRARVEGYLESERHAPKKRAAAKKAPAGKAAAKPAAKPAGRKFQ